MRKRIEHLELNSCQFVVLLFYGYRRPAVASGINPPPRDRKMFYGLGYQVSQKAPSYFLDRER